MIYLFDTNAFADLMREHPLLITHLESLSPQDRLMICSIVKGEIMYGIGRLSIGKRQRDLATKAERLFATIPCESIPAAAADHYAQIKIVRSQKGLAMDENDLWIAATALHLGANLVSRDKDFKQVADLPVVDWTLSV